MKLIVISLTAALLAAAQLLIPAAPVLAASSTSALAETTCGDTYTVQRGDYLSAIARTCGVTLTDLLNANPEITNINRIFPGQVIRIKSGATIPTNPTPPTTGTTTYTVQRGDTLSGIAAKFGTTWTELAKLNPSITDPSKIFWGQVITIKSGTTTTTPAPTGARVTISSTGVKPGGELTVKVYGFPAKAEIDFRTGKKDAAFSGVKDATTDSTGYATATIAIPSTAVKGEQWVVKVMTTSLRTGVEVTSATITIQ